MILGQNELLREITQGIFSEEPDWTALMQEFREVGYNTSCLSGRIAEIYLRKSLEKKLKGKDAQFDPISDGASGDYFTFYREKGHVYEQSKGKNFMKIILRWINLLLLMDSQFFLK